MHWKQEGRLLQTVLITLNSSLLIIEIFKYNEKMLKQALKGSVFSSTLDKTFD